MPEGEAGIGAALKEGATQLSDLQERLWTLLQKDIPVPGTEPRTEVQVREEVRQALVPIYGQVAYLAGLLQGIAESWRDVGGE